MEARLHASYKDKMVARQSAYYSSQPGRGGVQTAIGICKLGMYFRELRQDIERRAPLARLCTVAIADNVDDEAKYAADYMDAVPADFGPLRRLFGALRGSRRVAEGDDCTQLFSFDTECLIGQKLADDGVPLEGSALYVDPPECRRLVFLGVATESAANHLAAAMARPDFNWRPYSGRYAVYRSRSDEC